MKFIGKTRNKDDYESIVVLRDEYRRIFGIVDQCLVSCRYDKETDTGFIVYIDYKYDVIWRDRGYLSKWSEEEMDAFRKAICKLDYAQMYPCEILTSRKKLDFKRMLGVGYLQALNQQYDQIDNVLEEARSYVENRNEERARSFFLSFSSLLIVINLFFYILQSNGILTPPWEMDFTAAISFGIIGSYTSIWSRFNKLQMNGLSTRFALVVESLSRLMIGCVSALVILMAFKSGLILSVMNDDNAIYSSSIIGFVAGFSERWLDSIVEKVQDMSRGDKQNQNTRPSDDIDNMQAYEKVPTEATDEKEI